CTSPRCNARSTATVGLPVSRRAAFSRSTAHTASTAASSARRHVLSRVALLVDAARLAAGALEPVEELGGRVDLVVVFAAREDRQLVQVFGAPSGLTGQVDKAVLDHRGLRVHAHDLVGLRLVAGDGVDAQLDQFLDQLGAGGLVLDQYDTGI